MRNQLHHVVMLSHSATRFLGFLTDVVGMEVQHSFRVPGRYSRRLLGGHRLRERTSRSWAVAWQGSSRCSTFPNSYVQPRPKDLPHCPFWADDYGTMQDKARQFTDDVRFSIRGCLVLTCSSAPWAACRWS